MRFSSIRERWRQQAPCRWKQSGYLPEVTYVAAVILAWVGGSWHWLSGRKHIPWDSIDYFFPQVAFVVTAIRGGQSPTWNPLAFGGQPVLGDPQGMLFTPHVATGILSGRLFGLHVFDLTTLLCVLAGGLCLYAYVRRWGAAPALAALGAVVFMLGGVATSRLQHVSQVVSYCLLPALLLAIQEVARRPGATAVGSLTAVGLLLALNPNQVVFLAPALLLPIVAIEVARAGRPARSTLALAVSGILVALLASPVAASLLEVVQHSNRSSLLLANSAPGSLPLHASLSLLIPGLYGTLSPDRTWWSPVNITESYLYVGVVPALLVLWSVARRHRPPGIVLAAWVGGAAAFLLAMGVHAPLYPWLFENVPGFGLFRRPSDAGYYVNLYVALATGLAAVPGGSRARSMPERLLLPAAACVILAGALLRIVAHAEVAGQVQSLASSGLQALVRVACVGAVCAALWLTTRRGRPRAVLGLAALGLTTADLSTAGRYDVFSSSYATHEDSLLLRRLGPGMQNDLQVALSLRHLQSAGGTQWRTEVLGGGLGRQMPIALGLPVTQGYNPLVLRSYAEVFGSQSLGDEPKRFSEAAPSYDAAPYRWLGLRFVLLHRYIADNPSLFGAFGARLEEAARSAREAGAVELEAAGTYRILALPAAYPRAGLIPLHGGEQGPPERHCEVLSETTVRLLYRCQSPGPARLVVGDSYAPGWLACVNGQRTPVEPFLTALRSVEVPGGESLVELRYQPVPWLRRFSRCGGT